MTIDASRRADGEGATAALTTSSREIADAGSGYPPEGLAFGGDYNPEQWPEDVWLEDIARMREAGINLVSVGIFSWALIEPRPGEFDFAWLDQVIDLLNAADIKVDLATPTAGPPAWFYRQNPDAWVVDADGRRLGPGSRGVCCPSSAEFGQAAARITAALAERYGQHPAVVMWHVHNEYGAPVFECHCPRSAARFRSWLLDRYGDIDAVNRAWGTTFWGQRYGQIEEVCTPAATASVINPAHRLDFLRFCDAELRACFIRERDIIRAHTDAPVTTNFMASSCPATDLWKWRAEVDVVSNDHYLTAERPDAHVMLSMDADLTRSLADNDPWLLMEHSTSAVSWQPRNLAKRAGEMTLNSLAHVARGADGVLFFQWRASRSGAEKFHSAMLPHAGTSSRVWRETVELGADVGRLGAVRGSRVRAPVALLWDWESFWAQDLEWRPSVDLNHRERVETFYTRLWRDKVTVDFVHPEADLGRYRLVIAPQLYLLGEAGAANLTRFVTTGGQLFVSYFSGVVDENDTVHAQGLSGPLGDLLGLSVHEFAPLGSGDTVLIETADGRFTGDVWTDRIVTSSRDTQVIGRFVDGPAAGGPALTRRPLGLGAAWYLSTRVDVDTLAGLLDPVYAAAQVEPRRDLPESLEIVTREGADASYTFYLNHGPDELPVPGAGLELLTGQYAQAHRVPPFGVRVVRREPRVTDPSTSHSTDRSTE